MSQASEIVAQHTARQAQAIADALAQKRYTLGDALALNLLEALEVWAMTADDPTQAACLVAKDQLRRFAIVWEQAQAARAGIHLARSQPGVVNGGS